MIHLVVLCQHWARVDNKSFGRCALDARTKTAGFCKRCDKFAAMTSSPDPDRVAEIHIPDEPAKDEPLADAEVALCVNRFMEWHPDAWRRMRDAKIRDRRGGRQMVIPREVFDREAVHWVPPG